MSAAAIITALESNLITEAEAVEQAMADDLNDLYRKAVLELAPHLVGRSMEATRSLSC